MRERAQRFDPRQHMQRPTFEIFHYREPRGEGVQIHHHDFYEVYFLLDGDVEYWVDGGIYRLKPGDLMLINPQEFHRPIVTGDTGIYERIVLWINKDYLESLADHDFLSLCFDKASPTHTNLLHPSAAQRASLHDRLGQLIRESYSTEPGAQACATSVFLQFMTEVNRMALRADARRGAQQESSPLVTRVITYIREHCREELSLDGLAQRFYVSKYHLSHEFSREVGIGVYRYILLNRLSMARQLLAEGIAPGDVCVHCGFKDYTAFFRAFKAEYGVSPRESATD